MVAIEASVEKWLAGRKIKNRSMDYGSHIHKLIEHGHLDVPRLGKPERSYVAQVPTGKGKGMFNVVGKIDDHDDTTIIDYKTCQKLWTKKQAQEHDQLKGYAFLLWKNSGKLPTKGVIVALETAYDEDVDDVALTGKSVVLEVPITLLDVLKVQARFQAAYSKVINHLRNEVKLVKQ
jgi:hypothetical protein